MPRDTGRPSSAPSRWARTADEAKRMLDTAERAGIFAGYLEDMVLRAEDAEGGCGSC